MKLRAVVYALTLTGCGGLVQSDPASYDAPRRGLTPDDASCVLGDDEVQGFAVDDSAIWRVQTECRRDKGGSVVVREDRATGERRIVAERLWGTPPATLAGSALLLRNKDALRRVRTDTGAIDDVTIRAQLLASDGDAAFAVVNGGTTESRYAVMRVAAEGDPSPVGTISPSFQMQALAASKSGVFATLWSVCSGTSSCVGLYTVGPDGAHQVAAWPVTDVGVTLGPLAVKDDRAVTAIGRDVVEASGGVVRTLATIDEGASVASIALGDGGGTYACLASSDASAPQRIVAVDAGGVTEIATGKCGELFWSAGELFWDQPQERNRYGYTLLVSTIGRRKVD